MKAKKYLLVLILLIINYNLYATPVSMSYNVTLIDCSDSCSHVIQVTPHGGLGTYHIYLYTQTGTLISTITSCSSTCSFSSLCPGTYNVYVVDVSFPYDQTSSLVSVINQAFYLTADVFGVSFYSSSDGEVVLHPHNGLITYEYKIGTSSYQTSNTFSNLPIGTYLFTAHDTNNCTATISVNIIRDNSCCLSVGDTVRFHVSNQANVVQWIWDFEDGNHATTLTNSVQHIFSTSGLYEVNVSGLNNIGLPVFGPNVIAVEIHEPGACSDTCPLPDFSFYIDECQLTKTYFHGSAKFPDCRDDSTNFSFIWNFGDPSSGADNVSTLQDPAHIFPHHGNYNVTLTIDSLGDCNRSITKEIIIPHDSVHIIIEPNPAYINSEISISFSGGNPNFLYTIPYLNFGDGSSSEIVSDITQSFIHNYTHTGNFQIALLYSIGAAAGCSYSDSITILPFVTLPCIDCIGSFDPEPGKEYLISAWVREDAAIPTRTNYTYPSLLLSFPDTSAHTVTTLPQMLATGDIIDGWQRIEEKFRVPLTAVHLTIQLACSTGDCLFDDIRVFPFDGTMKSYVYNPVSLKLAAELDERNYATLYEYDEEGKLIRVKKETERGIMTIKEIRNHLSSK